MSGHSHSSNVKGRKDSADQRRARAFSKVSQEIMAAASKGRDSDFNAALKAAIQRARALNVPSANIERAIANGSSPCRRGRQ
jgi:transcriptional/translational regulatory protein YebC/TACO1